MAASATVNYYRESGAPVVKTYTLKAASRLNILVNHEVPNSALAMKIESNSLIYAERAVYLNLDGHVSHGMAAPSTTWYFAEGATVPPFQTWILLANPNANTAHATVSFLKEDGNVVERSYNIAPGTRLNVFANTHVPNAAIATTVVSDLPIVAERSMYFGTGSHGSTGVSAPGTSWYLAEGYTGGGFDTWILLANPGAISAQATINFLKDDGTVTTRTFTVGARSRLNVYANNHVPNAAFATRITSSQPIVVERAMYFGPGSARGGHNAEAAAAPAQVWNLPEGSTQSAFNTFVLIMNPGDSTANVTVRFLLEAGASATQSYRVLPHSRYTLWANQLLPAVAFSTVVSSDQPVVVERAMYFNNNSGGTVSLGIPVTSGAATRK